MWKKLKKRGSDENDGGDVHFARLLDGDHGIGNHAGVLQQGGALGAGCGCYGVRREVH
jgi:hypothetical protein